MTEWHIFYCLSSPHAISLIWEPPPSLQTSAPVRPDSPICPQPFPIKDEGVGKSDPKWATENLPAGKLKLIPKDRESASAHTWNKQQGNSDAKRPLKRESREGQFVLQK